MKRQDAEHRFDGARGAGGVSREGLGGGYGRHLVAEEPFHSLALADIVVWGTCAVRVDVVNVGRL